MAPCDLLAVSDPTAEPGTWFGWLVGGPVVDPGGASLTLTCTGQVDAPTHDGPDRVRITGEGRAVATAGPAFATLTAFPGEVVYVCTQVDGPAGRLNWDRDAGAWSASASALCDLMAGDSESCECEPLIDRLLCPVLDDVLPPDGDIVLPQPVGRIWDCPPYEWV